MLRSQKGSVRLVGFVLIAVFAQIARNWLLLHAVGVDASLFDAIAVLIAVVSLGQLPFGLSVGAAAAVLILGPRAWPPPRRRVCCSPRRARSADSPSRRGPRSTCSRCAG